MRLVIRLISHSLAFGARMLCCDPIGCLSKRLIHDVSPKITRGKALTDDDTF